MVTTNQRLVLTVEEAGELLNVSRPTAYGLVKEGRIPVIRLRRKILIPRKALEDFLADIKPARIQ